MLLKVKHMWRLPYHHSLQIFGSLSWNSKTFAPVVRLSSTTSSTKMLGWQIQGYGDVEELMLKSVRQPIIRSPDELLVKVHASSVNPIDVRMMEGYGRNLLNVMRKQKGVIRSGTEFPLILGRDFSGTVVEVGQGAYKFNIGDEVWGAISAERPGTHAEYTVVSQKEISLKPKNIDHLEAASIPYVAMTTWAALCTVGNMTEKNAVGKRVLILGGAGGIGTFTIQMMRSWGAEVTVTCSADAADFLKGLGAAATVDYKSGNLWSELKELEKFDVILDAVGNEAPEKIVSVLSPWQNSKLISLRSPTLSNSDSLGVVPGMVKTAFQAGLDTFKGAVSGSSVRWAFFLPNGKAMNKVKQMVEVGQIKPAVQKVFPFSQGATAFQTVSDGHLRGKIVIDSLDKS